MKHITYSWGLFIFIATLTLISSNSGATVADDPWPDSRICTDLKVNEGERIFFIRKRNVDGLWLGDIYSMKPDGSDVQRYTNFSDNYFVTELPQISRNGRSLAFISNYESWKSAFYADAFIIDLQTGEFKRVTGSEKTSPAVEFGTVNVTVEDPKDWARTPSAIRISYRGCSNFVTGNSAVLTVPANEDIWVKAEFAKAKGDLKVIQVGAGESKQLNLNLENGSITAEHVYPSNDGSKLAVALNNESAAFPFYTISMWDIGKSEMLDEVSGLRQGGDTYPAFSPDGSILAFCTGQHTLNSLAFVPMNNLDATPTILARGNNIGIQAFCAQPSWSPDGSEIVFVYTTIATSFRGTEIQSNLYKVSIDGGDPIQLTAFSGNEIVSKPSFSPDGDFIAFSLLNSLGDVFLLSDLINLNYTSDVYAISSKKATLAKSESTLVALTNDGHSLDPSWGKVSTGVGVQEGRIPLESIYLSQNYPNPFSSATNLDYDIPELTDVTIVVYDIVGRPTAVLIDSKQVAGHYRTSWNGKDSSGHLAPNGVYIYTITADGYSFSRRMVLKR